MENQKKIDWKQYAGFHSNGGVHPTFAIVYFVSPAYAEMTDPSANK